VYIRHWANTINNIEKHGEEKEDKLYNYANDGCQCEMRVVVVVVVVVVVCGCLFIFSKYA
jgi:hypothetical protein